MLALSMNAFLDTYHVLLIHLTKPGRLSNTEQHVLVGVQLQKPEYAPAHFSKEIFTAEKQMA